MPHEEEQSKRIRELNDNLRRTFTRGDVFKSVGIDALPADVQANIFEKVRTFSEFTEENDPYGEHDYGSFEIADQIVCWKIDYYDPTLQGGSEDPSDPAKTRRVLTIAFPHEV